MMMTYVDDVGVTDDSLTEWQIFQLKTGGGAGRRVQPSQILRLTYAVWAGEPD